MNNYNIVQIIVWIILRNISVIIVEMLFSNPINKFRTRFIIIMYVYRKVCKLRKYIGMILQNNADVKNNDSVFIVVITQFQKDIYEINNINQYLDEIDTQNAKLVCDKETYYVPKYCLMKIQRKLKWCKTENFLLKKE